MSTTISSLKAALTDTDISQQIADLRADLARLLETASDDVSDGLGNAGRKLRRTGRDAQAGATKLVIDHPLATVGLAMAAALLVVLVVSRRS